MGRPVRTINHAMIPKNRTDESAKSHKRGVFTVGNLVVVRDFRIDHIWTAETVVKRRGKVIY
ncbi:unnamed protein product [Hymenolepis diminuta]|uniref:DUF5641 domain-containing protein n=1 Tax=Hymenolepis diminuta TaxID=6216 RepID=A0A564Y439_HYMDI|nr:unnamed protein product [Hymenolepis diminuta]